jgi:autotransporter-associated beta strand protein
MRLFLWGESALNQVLKASAIFMAIALVIPAVAAATNGTWVSPTVGNWADTANWAGGVVANGANAVANFTNDVGYGYTITTSGQTIGTVNFDTSPTWALDVSGLTFAGSSPTINSGKTTRASETLISGDLKGSNGLTKTGPGELYLYTNSSSTLTGGFTLNAGTLVFPTNLGYIGSGALTIHGGTLATFPYGARTTPVSSNVIAAGDFSFSGDYSSGAGLPWEMSGGVTLSGGNRTLSLYPDNTSLFYYISTSRVKLSGVISDGGNGYGLTINNKTSGANGNIQLSGNNTYTGVTVLGGTVSASLGVTNAWLTGTSTTSSVTVENTGRLVIGNNNALGAGTLTLRGTNASLAASVSPRTIPNALRLEGNLNFTNPYSLFATTAAGLTVNGLTTLTGTRIINVTTAASAPLTLAGGITDGGNGYGITKNGTGKLILGGVISYSGPTVVNAGTLSINGTLTTPNDYTVPASATLGGSGAINLAAGKKVTVNSSGIIAPGNSIGTLTVSGGLGIKLDGKLSIELSSNTASDLLNLTSGAGLDLSGSTDILELLPTAGSLLGNYTLVNYGGTLTGTFNQVFYNGSLVANPTAPGSIGTYYNLDYGTGSTSQIRLVAIPEPASASLLAAGLIMIGRRRRR